MGLRKLSICGGMLEQVASRLIAVKSARIVAEQEPGGGRPHCQRCKAMRVSHAGQWQGLSDLTDSLRG